MAGFFLFFFFPPLISPHLKKAPDRRRRLAAAHAGHRACSAPQDPQTPLLGIWEGGEGGASSPPPLRLRISPHFGRRILTEAMPEGLRGGMGSRGGVEGGAARGAARHVYPHSGWESGPTELHPCGATASGGCPTPCRRVRPPPAPGWLRAACIHPADVGERLNCRGRKAAGLPPAPCLSSPPCREPSCPTSTR